MTLTAVLLALLPLALVFILLLVMNKPADIAGLCGLVCAIAVSCLFFGTPLHVALLAALSGAVASLPISLAVGASAFQISVMAEAGALTRIISFIKTVAPTDRAIQVLLINCGIGILFTSFGGITMTIFPPIFLGLGYSVIAAIALPCLGYTGACIYALMGVPVVIFAGQTGMDLKSAGILAAEFLPFILFAVTLACLWITGKWEMLRKGFIPGLAACVCSGLIALPLASVGIITLAGIAVGSLYCTVLLIFLKLRRQPILSSEGSSGPFTATGQPMSLAVAVSPWLMLVAVSIIINTPVFGVFDYLFNKISMPVEIIPGRPDRLRVFWQVYFWVLVSTFLCLPLLKVNRKIFRAALSRAATRVPRPVAALVLFFSISSVYIYSGFTSGWNPAPQQGNMVGVLSLSAASVFGTAYMLVAPFLGLLAGVISGSQSAAIAMVSKLHLDVAAHIGASGGLIAFFSAMAGGLAGAISPAKVMSASASIDCIGKEGSVLRAMIGTVLLVTAFLSILGMIWLVLGL